MVPRLERLSAHALVGMLSGVGIVCELYRSIAYMMIGTNPNITLVEHAVNDLWMRDTGPILVTDDNNEHMRAVDFNFNGWGGKRQHALDATVASRVAMEAGADLAVSPLVLEGGCVEVNGQGTRCIGMEACMFSLKRVGMVCKFVWGRVVQRTNQEMELSKDETGEGMYCVFHFKCLAL